MESFFSGAGGASFFGLIVVFAIAIVAPAAGWSRLSVARALGILLAVAVAEGVRAQWDVPGYYSYVVAGIVCGVLWVIADFTHKRQAAPVET